MDSGIPNMEEPSRSTCQRGSRPPRAFNQRNTEAHGKGVRQALRKPEIDLPAGRSAVPEGQGDSILVCSPSPWVLGEGVLAPSSPDLNPMDYSIWSILEVNACVTSHAKVEALKASLKTAWVALSQNVVRATASIDAGGRFRAAPGGRGAC